MNNSIDNEILTFYNKFTFINHNDFYVTLFQGKRYTIVGGPHRNAIKYFRMVFFNPI